MYNYINGNYKVVLESDGTKFRETFNKNDNFYPDFPESCDIKITNLCDLGIDGRNECPFCHEQSNLKGRHANLQTILDAWRDMPAGVELAIGGGNPLAHPDLYEFLHKAKQQGLVCNLTVNKIHLNQIRYFNLLRKLIDGSLVYGIGISSRSTKQEFTNNLIDFFNDYPHAVLHVINGIDDIDEVGALSLQIKQPKILVLGYKNYGNGLNYYNEQVKNNQKIWYNKLAILTSSVAQRGGIVSFDNLAIEQLNVKRLVNNWEEFYQGDDGSFTFYLDAVEKMFSVSSTSSIRFSSEGLTAKEMFNKL